MWKFEVSLKKGDDKLFGEAETGEITSAIQSACKALEGILVGLDAERKREELVGDIHGAWLCGLG